MIYDCFTFFNELDILELRLELLNERVDWFVLSESPKTHSGITKPLHYAQNAERFKKFAHKIIHVVADDFPNFDNSWSYENYQRNALATALKKCNPTDIVLISDVDEIPKLEKLPSLINDGEVVCFLQDLYYYYINNYRSNKIIWEGGTKAVTYRTLANNLLNDRFVKYNQHSFPESLNQGSTCTKVRLYRYLTFVSSGGWHLSYMGGVKSIANKLRAFSHQEFNNDSFNSEDYILNCLENGKDLLEPQVKCFVVKKNIFPEIFPAILSDKYFIERGNEQLVLKYYLRRISELFSIYLRNYARWMYLRTR